jgi:cellulose biosynthesis protein BcsQ
MRICAVSGKGGVGKTTISSGLVSALAETATTLIVDCDKKGNAIRRTFFPEGDSLDFSIRGDMIKISGNLFAATIPDCTFDSLRRADKKPSKKERDEEFREYMSQFPEDYGIVAFQDMMETFFGVNTNPEAVMRHITLSNLLLNANKKGIENVVLDLEPTQGTARLLTNATDTARILRNMSKYGVATLTMIAAKFPDITRLLKSDYIKHADIYGQRIEVSAKMIREAKYLLVCGTESAKVDEMLLDTEPIIESFGGRVCGYVINDVRNYTGAEKKSADTQKRRVEKIGMANGVSVVQVNHNPLLCIDEVSNSERREELTKVGRYIVKSLAREDD